ncbi:MAG: preprotein translocase subunit SecG [Kiritimatiellae bacterium]|nr:preprotein translocase subunit SecG [Kiritimatiellia bacterium]
MIIVKYLLISIEAIVSLLLIGIILLQKSKSEGLGMAFGSGMGETLFGSRAGNVLTKGTVILTVVFMVTTIALGIVFSGDTQSKSLLGAPEAVPVQQEAPMQSSPMAQQMPAAVPAPVAVAPMEAQQAPMDAEAAE